MYSSHFSANLAGGSKDPAGLPYPVPRNVPTAPNDILIQQKIKALKLQMLFQRAALQRLEGEVKRHQAIVSPLRRLPPAILGEIFGLTIPDYLDEVDRRELGYLCLVCKSWRDAAHRTRRLWSNVQINISQSLLDYDKMETWLTRAGNVPRRIKVVYIWAVCCCPVYDCVLTGCVALLKLLEDGPSLDHLHLQRTGARCIERFFNLMHTSKRRTKIRPWDSLRSLSFDMRFPPTPHDDKKGLVASSSEYVDLDLPLSVTSFDLALPPLGDMGVQIRPGFIESLTSFSIKCGGQHNGEWILRLLELCINVEVLKISLDMSFSRHRISPLFKKLSAQGLTFPNVHTLHLRHLNSTSIPFLDIFKTPALDTLDLSFKPDFTFHDGEPQEALTSHFISSLTSFIHKRSQCAKTLRSLRIHHVNFEETEEFAELLIGLPSLTHLAINRPVFMDDLFSEIQAAADNAEEQPLPSLQILEMLQLPLDFDFNGLFAFLRSRRSLHADSGERDPPGGPPDGVRKLNVTFYRNQRTLDQSVGDNAEDRDSNSIRYISTLRRFEKVLVNIGPR